MAAPRSIGSLTVSFGLVAIPVKLFTATQSQNSISFNMVVLSPLTILGFCIFS